jgi:hypothetical protein
MMTFAYSCCVQKTEWSKCYSGWRVAVHLRDNRLGNHSFGKRLGSEPDSSKAKKGFEVNLLVQVVWLDPQMLGWVWSFMLWNYLALPSIERSDTWSVSNESLRRDETRRDEMNLLWRLNLASNTILAWVFPGQVLGFRIISTYHKKDEDSTSSTCSYSKEPQERRRRCITYRI